MGYYLIFISLIISKRTNTKRRNLFPFNFLAKTDSDISTSPAMLTIIWYF